LSRRRLRGSVPPKEAPSSGKQKGLLLARVSILDLYMRVAGVTEIPSIYHRWCCLAAIASCVSDRVWLEKFRHERLVPNLYTFLIGRSGTFKSAAINVASRLLAEVAPAVGYYRGSLTGAALIQMLSMQPSEQTPRPGRRFMVMDELAFALGDKIQADPFIKSATGLYSGGDYTLSKGVVTRPWVTVSGHCLNWLAGTTVEWLRECISSSAIEGGFFARVACILGIRDPRTRIYNPGYPVDVEAAEAELRSRFKELTQLSGLFQFTSDARALDKAWYEHRDPEGPPDEMEPWWFRRPVFVLKIAMLLSLAESTSLVLTASHIARAIALTDEVSASVPTVIRSAGAGIDAKMLHLVETMVRESTPLLHSKLLSRLSPRGMTAQKLKLYIDTLTEAGKLKQAQSQGGGKVYVYAGKNGTSGSQRAAKQKGGGV